MRPLVSHQGKIRLYPADSRDALKLLPSNSIDSIVTDPPYALVNTAKRFGKEGAAPAQYGRDGLYQRASAGFMGEDWDTGETVFAVEFWEEVLRVLKPGGHLVAFGGTRTFHRLVCSIEDAGFEVRDLLGWVYGSGFPKSKDVELYLTKQGDFDLAAEWAGYGTALKPAWEPISLARKPFPGTLLENVREHGAGPLNIDGCRVPLLEGETVYATRNVSLGSSGAGVFGAGNTPGVYENSEGRWPANILHDGGEGVALVLNETQRRFFYCAKANAKDRDEGLEDLAIADSGIYAVPLTGAGNPRDVKRKNIHPTVKPEAVMRWLVRLVTPQGGIVLDPFMGSGSTGKAAMLEGMEFIGIERNAKYLPIAERRIQHAARWFEDEKWRSTVGG